MRIAVFDYLVIPTNPIGSCHRTMLHALADEHEFTVFAIRFDNPRPDRIKFVRVPCPTRPLALLFLCYHLIAPIVYLWHKLRHRPKFDQVQVVESNNLFGDISYTHFCHRAFLRDHWDKVKAPNLRSRFKYLDHKLHALFEPLTFRRVKRLAVPSIGVGRDLVKSYPFLDGRVTTIFNSVDIPRMQPPPEYDRAARRKELGYGPDDVVLIFMALGHFERKGMPLLLEALRRYDEPRLKLMVVGGTDDLLSTYRARVADMGLAPRVQFLGLQKDVRPFLWAADAFTLPSLYEAFALVVLEAAAAGVPLIVTPINGVEEFVIDGQNGYLVKPDAADIERRLREFVARPADERRRVGENARSAMPRFTVQAFIDNWRSFYAQSI